MIDRPYIERMELFKNLGARRGQIHDQKILPLIDEFMSEITEHQVLHDLKTTKLFMKFIEYFNEFVDVSEEVYKQLIEAIEEMNKINADEYVPIEQYQELQDNYDALQNTTEVKNIPTRNMPVPTAATSTAFKMLNEQQAEFVQKIRAKVVQAEAENKNPAKMKTAFKLQLGAHTEWQAKLVDEVLNDYMKYKKTVLRAERASKKLMAKGGTLPALDWSQAAIESGTLLKERRMPGQPEEPAEDQTEGTEEAEEEPEDEDQEDDEGVEGGDTQDEN